MLSFKMGFRRAFGLSDNAVSGSCFTARWAARARIVGREVCLIDETNWPYRPKDDRRSMQSKLDKLQHGSKKIQDARWPHQLESLRNLRLNPPLARYLYNPRIKIMSKCYELTPKQLALSQERKVKKAKLATEKATVEEDKGRILDRKWIQLRSTDAQEYPIQRVKVMTWNVCLFCLPEQIHQS